MSVEKQEKQESIEVLTPVPAVATLTEREAHAYRIWQGTTRPSLAPSLNVKLFALFLQGKDAEEIRRLNPSLTLGDIVAAQVQGEWVARRRDHLDHLLREAATRVQQATLESADLVCDLLAVANRQHGDRLRRYLQTGDETELKDFKIDSIFGLKQAIETLQKLTGQDRRQVVDHQGEVLHRGVPAPAADTPTTAVEAAEALRRLLSKPAKEN
jgi:hypothetical protein